MDNINKINETGGAGDWGTDKARERLQKDTPGQYINKGKKMKTFKEMLSTIEEAMSDADKKKRLALIKRAVEKFRKQELQKAKKAAMADMKAAGMFDEEVELDEGMHDRYIRAHGKKASGRGGWMFTTKPMGSVDYKNDKEFYQHPGQETLNVAAAAAKKVLGSNIYVMESVDLDEGRNEVVKSLEDLVKIGGYDKKDFQKALDLYKAGNLNGLRKHIYGLDTDPSETIAAIIATGDDASFMKMYPNAKGGEYLRSIVISHGGK